MLPTEGFDFHHRLPFRSTAEGLVDDIRQAMESRDEPGWGELVALYNSAHGTGDGSEKTAAYIREVCQ